MRILLIGDWHSEVHEEWIYRAFQTLGHEVYPFRWQRYFQLDQPLSGPAGKLAQYVLRAQNRFIIGPRVAALNREVLQEAERFGPDLVFVYRGTHIWPETLRRLKAGHPGAVLAGYNNDNPFGSGQVRGLWRFFLRGLPDYDLVLAYRPQNLTDFKMAGAKRVELLRSWFVPERNHPVELSQEDREEYGSEVVFAGNYEPEGRLEWLEEVSKAGFQLKLFGPGQYWDKVLRRSPYLSHLAPVRQVWGEDYNKALCGAKVALCLLSKMNLDTYTRRCFEIPATKTMLLSEYTDDLATLYVEGEEAEFFRSKQELIAKLRRYVADEALRRRVAEAGYRRVVADGHDVVSRMRQVITWVNELRQGPQ
ncbi:MAG: glycosyltransferase [Deltaproteobacteria bacterium]|jgi:spore maturation protein CgeB